MALPDAPCVPVVHLWLACCLGPAGYFFFPSLALISLSAASSAFFLAWKACSCRAQCNWHSEQAVCSQSRLCPA